MSTATTSFLTWNQTLLFIEVAKEIFCQHRSVDDRRRRGAVSYVSEQCALPVSKQKEEKEGGRQEKAKKFAGPQAERRDKKRELRGKVL